MKSIKSLSILTMSVLMLIACGDDEYDVGYINGVQNALMI